MSVSFDHTASYYAASRNDHTRYPPLGGDVTADVAIIGAGFSGISTALFLAERGARVVVLEANRVGWGASGRNGGQIIGGLQGDKRIKRELGSEGEALVANLWYRGHDIIEDRVKRYAIDCDLKRGFIEVAVKPAHTGALAVWAEAMAKSGVARDWEVIGRDETARLVGTDRYFGALIDPRSGHCHPLNLCLGEARAAVSLGVVIHEESEVLDIVHGDRPVLVTARGRVTANTVVLAGNAYHRLERRKLGGKLFPAGTYVVATETLSPAVLARLNPRGFAVCDSSIALDYWRFSADGRLLFGGLCTYDNRDPVSIAEALRPRLQAVYPELAGVAIDYQWGGQIGIVISRVPLIGRVADNVFHLEGYSGHGVNVTHLASEIIADAIGGDARRLELFERVRQYRLPVGRWLGNQLLALGMAYYQIKDRWF